MSHPTPGRPRPRPHTAPSGPTALLKPPSAPHRPLNTRVHAGHAAVSVRLVPVDAQPLCPSVSGLWGRWRGGPGVPHAELPACSTPDLQWCPCAGCAHTCADACEQGCAHICVVCAGGVHTSPPRLPPSPAGVLRVPPRPWGLPGSPAWPMAKAAAAPRACAVISQGCGARARCPAPLPRDCAGVGAAAGAWPIAAVPTVPRWEPALVTPGVPAWLPGLASSKDPKSPLRHPHGHLHKHLPAG